ncbi:cytochrome o ubiquinol oxidase subunit IV [Bordetella avium]|uniref:Cytochrome bo(3) ubiquinol oxidase subunit 4 n=1 Tax=Bordetella avium (strain 197N) TaxID=360910 RepID=Q2KWP0_BORA1|nr:cytochrome o ubiquinol oxidase subunit IV [Bordetella avium]AZY48323.1 cytochrome o ubiquinol oxidase subunit IV [Bordetella avium]RIQ13432.1 cytochrome o ubiquinol oxidase subunit IV [Bordetella avium]RIQ36777.1 cytochrome o ubiquinol oxidase subunit IV [Bordetella avium]RIQ40758.1 cytochrome o ubiquinol oxidase subunit IV [Bordetella avium]RIQ42417.1 cytochrome o ubiquinol oxidase subunit IV [Bordetella avium]
MSAHHDAAHADGGHGSLKSYIIGFILSIILTLGSFWLVMNGTFSRPLVLGGILVLCVVQLLVQLVFFMHMGTAKSEQDNLSAFLFTVMIIAIIVGGSIWVLHNMNANMLHPMP